MGIGRMQIGCTLTQSHDPGGEGADQKGERQARQG